MASRTTPGQIVQLLSLMPQDEVIAIMKQVCNDRPKVRMTLLDDFLTQEHCKQVQAFLDKGEILTEDLDDTSDNSSQFEYAGSSESGFATPSMVDTPKNSCHLPSYPVPLPGHLDGGDSQDVTVLCWSHAEDSEAGLAESSTEVVSPPPGLASPLANKLKPLSLQLAIDGPVAPKSAAAPEKHLLNLSSLLDADENTDAEKAKWQKEISWSLAKAVDSEVLQAGKAPQDSNECLQVCADAGSRDKTLLIAYFPRQATEGNLTEAFEALARVQRVRLVREKSGQSRCFGFVEFRTKADAETALLACERRRVMLDDETGHTWHLTASWAKGTTSHGSGTRHRGRGRRGGAKNTSMAVPVGQVVHQRTQV